MKFLYAVDKAQVQVGHIRRDYWRAALLRSRGQAHSAAPPANARAKKSLRFRDIFLLFDILRMPRQYEADAAF